MTQMVQTAISTLGATLKSGYLQNLEGANESTAGYPLTNVNIDCLGNFTNSDRRSVIHLFRYLSCRI